ncbi:MAG TPA: twin-arginine translocase subunit TatC [Candidatus Acidoferrum sp.]|nr:twin-arginine translocase subunit TatC [Candidatus Acidoferrum sp.]
MADEKKHDPKEQPLIAHLIELRDRIIRSLLCVLVIFLALFYFSNDIFDFVVHPAAQAMVKGQHMIATKPLDTFFIPFTMTMMVAFFISIPYIMHQIWAFVAPGLYHNEIRITLPILISSIVLFYVGMAFAYYAVLPLIFKFASGTSPSDVVYTPDINYIYDLLMRMFLVFGFVFEVPVATILLILAGVVDPEKLKEYRGYVVIGCFTIGMMVTPPDVFSQTLVAVPMWMLFEGGLFFGKMMKRKRVEAAKANAAD